MGHIVGVRATWYPQDIPDTLRLLALVSTARSHDSGEHGVELIESFPNAFAPRDGHTGGPRLLEKYTAATDSSSAPLFMFPKTYAAHDMPSAMPGLLWVWGRIPLITAIELARRIPPVGRVHERIMCAHRENWYRAQMAGREAEFDASGALRR